MRLLFDTHLLLWAASQPEMSSLEARTIIEDPLNSLQFSAASLWKIAIKNGMGRSDFKVDPRLLRRGLIDNGYGELAVTSAHALLWTACRRFMKIRSTGSWSRKRLWKASSCSHPMLSWRGTRGR